jgi:parallel beta-helix repeat protein
MYGGASRNRLRGNRLIGNGYAAQGKNFGIGLIGFAAGPGNMIEENTAAGNANGIFLGPGVQGTVIRRNILVGNPPVQVSVDHTSLGGWDIQNLSDDGANTFRG